MKRTAIIIAACLMLGRAVYAQSLELNFNTQTSTLEISGSLGSGLSGEVVSLTVYKTSDGISGVSSMKPGSLNWYDETTAKEDGSYSFGYVINGERGESYTVRVNAEGMDADEKNFTYYPADETETIIDMLKEYQKNDDADSTVSLVETYKDYLQLDTTLYDKLDTENKKQAAFKALKAFSGDISSFKQGFDAASFVVFMNITEDTALYEENLLKKLEKSAPGAYSYYTKSEDTEKKSALISKMMEEDFDSEESLVTSFMDSVILEEVNKASDGTWPDMLKVIESVKDDIKIDFADYNKLKTPSEAIKKLLGTEYKTTKQLKEAFEKSVKARKEAEGKKNTGTTGGRGGGGGGVSISGAGSMTVMPVVKPVKTTPFGDIESVAWAKESIEGLYAKKIITGDDKGNFNPNNPVTRAEFVKMLVSAMNLELKTEGEGFLDVAKDKWYHSYILTAAAESIVNGIGDGKFGPENVISRQDVAVIIYNAAKKLGIIEDSFANGEITDINTVSDYAKTAVETLYSEGMISGVGDGCYAPRDNMTRAQAAVIIWKFTDRMEGAK